MTPHSELRAQFAMAALTGMIASDRDFCHRLPDSSQYATMAKMAYLLADAMMKEAAKR